MTTSDPLHLLTSPPRPTRRRLWPTLLLVAAAVAVIGGGTLLALTLLSNDTVTVKGEVQLIGITNVKGEHDDCYGIGGYDDLRGGASVVVTDATGTTVGVGSLRPGVLNLSKDPYYCGLAFEIEVPAGKGFYGIEVTHRGRVQFSEAEAGAVRLSIGS